MANARRILVGEMLRIVAQVDRDSNSSRNKSGQSNFRMIQFVIGFVRQVKFQKRLVF